MLTDRDFESFVIQEAEDLGFKLVSKSLVVFYPKEMKDSHSLMVEQGSWGLLVTAKNREELIETTKEAILTQWKSLILTHDPLKEFEINIKNNLWKDFLMIIK